MVVVPMCDDETLYRLRAIDADLLEIGEVGRNILLTLSARIDQEPVAMSGMDGKAFPHPGSE